MRKVMAEIVQIFKQVLAEVSPRVSVEKALQVENSRLKVNDREYLLNQNVRIVAAGKAAVQMVVGAEHVLGNHILDGIASIPVGSNVPTFTLKTHFHEAAEHNLPDELAIQNTLKVLEFLEAYISNKSDAIVLFLISGGASALLCLPVDGVSLEDKLQVTRLLASNGADITQLNTVRIALSKVKGGQLAQRAAPSKAISLIISDIVGGRIDRVGSAPTVQQDINLQKARDVLKERGVWDQAPKSVQSFLQEPSTSLREEAIDIQNVLICDNRVLLESFKRQLELHGYETTIINSELEGNAREVGEQLAEPLQQWILGKSEISPPFNKFLVETERSARRFAWLYGGETTVQFPPNFSNSSAKGGRNQEMVLSVFGKLRSNLASSSSNRRIYFASLGSDGQDGPTDATGAIIHSDDLFCSDPIAGSWEEHLNNKDSYHFWSNFFDGRCLVKIGKTGNNLMDVQMLIFEEG